MSEKKRRNITSDIVCEKLRTFLYKNILLIISICISIIFIFVPLILMIPTAQEGITNLLKPLQITEYKTSYIGMLGSILGSFLAITGASWLQSKKDINDQKNLIKEKALIVYYDFMFAFDELETFLKAYQCSKRTTHEDEKQEINNFLIYFTNIHNLHLDSEWIRNVAKLHPIFNDKEIKKIYDLYGIFVTIKNTSEKDEENIDIRIVRKIYKLLNSEVFDLTTDPLIEVRIKKVNQEILGKLKNYCKLKD